jgi:hypothetical protein
MSTDQSSSDKNNKQKKEIRKNFSLFRNLEENLKALNDIDECIKITLGPTGKNGIVATKKDLKFITTGSLLIK